MATEKARIWETICYPENMVECWQDEIEDLLQIPFAYALHDLDHDSKSDHRKDHIHLILVFNNTTTKKYSIEVSNRLSKPGYQCCTTSQAVVGIRKAYDYLIHDTDNCRKQGKYQYPKEARITGNNFDIGSLEQLSQDDKDRMVEEMADMIHDQEITNFDDFRMAIKKNFDFQYVRLIKSYSGYFERIIKGVFHKKSIKDAILDNKNSEEMPAAELDPDQAPEEKPENPEECVIESNNIEEKEEIKEDTKQISEGIKPEAEEKKFTSDFKSFRMWGFDASSMDKKLQKSLLKCVKRGWVYKCVMDFGVPVTRVQAKQYINQFPLVEYKFLNPVLSVDKSTQRE